jgi:hypothetical protein
MNGVPADGGMRPGGVMQGGGRPIGGGLTNTPPAAPADTVQRIGPPVRTQLTNALMGATPPPGMMQGGPVPLSGSPPAAMPQPGVTNALPPGAPPPGMIGPATQLPPQLLAMLAQRGRGY